jgi:hypothetical protein
MTTAPELTACWNLLLGRAAAAPPGVLACAHPHPDLPPDWPPATRGGWVGRVPARHDYLPFLTLSDQIAMAMRNHSRWGSNAAARVAEVLDDLSHPHHPDLAAFARSWPSAWADKPHVAWRVGLARQLVLGPQTYTPGATLLVALPLAEWRRAGSSWPVEAQVGRVLARWSRAVGRVLLLTDCPRFAAQFARAEAPSADPVGPGSTADADRPTRTELERV